LLVTTQRWDGPGRYLCLGVPLLVLLAAHSWSDAWIGDFWIYVATVRELAEKPLHPGNPLLGNAYPFPFLSPYMWVLGVVSRFSGLPPFDVLAAQGVLNGALLLGALYAFVATWVRRPSAAVYALLFVLFLWGPDPWLFSGFFHLGSLALVLPYPSTFAAALAFGSLAAFTRLATARPWLWAPGTALALAFLWILHPVNGLFLCLGLTAFSLERRRPVGHWLALAGSVALSVGLALAWPLYPVGSLWFGQIGFVHAGNDAMYHDPLPRVLPALLGAPWLLVRLRRNHRDPLSVLAALLIALVVFGGVTGQWSFGRLISHAAIVLQVALADAAGALEERLGLLRRGAVLRPLLAPALVLLLLGISWPAVVRPLLREAWTGDPRWLGFLESRVGTDEVVMTDIDTCWYVPSFSGKVVAYPMQLPFVTDQAERVRAVERFFERGAPSAERDEILRRYGARYVLITRSTLPDWEASLAELRPLGRVIYSSADHELLRLERPSVGAAPPR
jgi:alpha-1,6-mannosyltransferase